MSNTNALTIVNKGRYAPLSNYFYSFDSNSPFISVAHIHYYNMATGDKARQDNIRKSKTIGNIFEALGHEILSRTSTQILYNKYYDINKTYGYLWLAISVKLIKNQNALRLLLETGDKQLLMMSGTDNILGVGKGRRGLNMTGNILMILRSELLKSKIIRPGPGFSLQEQKQNQEPPFDIEAEYTYCITPISFEDTRPPREEQSDNNLAL